MKNDKLIEEMISKTLEEVSHRDRIKILKKLLGFTRRILNQEKKIKD